MKYLVLLSAFSLGICYNAWGQLSSSLPEKKITYSTSIDQNLFGKNSTSIPKTDKDNSILKETLSQKVQQLKLGGVVNGGGGDARVIRSKILESKLPILIQEVTGVFQDPNPNRNATTSVRRLLAWISRGSMKLSDPVAQQILDDMIDKEFGKDLNNTKFILSTKCLDNQGIERSASAKMNEPRSDICVNPERIAKEFGPYIQDSDLMGLMMHEFAHHYGYADVDHSFAAEIAKAYQSDNEFRNQEGEPLNFLIKTEVF